MLILNGVDPCTKDYDGRTALHLAASCGRNTILDMLLSLDPPIERNPVDRLGGTPLEDAYRFELVCMHESGGMKSYLADRDCRSQGGFPPAVKHILRMRSRLSVIHRYQCVRAKMVCLHVHNGFMYAHQMVHVHGMMYSVACMRKIECMCIRVVYVHDRERQTPLLYVRDHRIISIFTHIRLNTNAWICRAV